MNTLTSGRFRSSALSVHMGLCAALGVVALAAPMADASAALVTTFANTSVAIPANVDGVYLNLVTGLGGTAGSGVLGWDINPYLTNSVFTLFWPSTPATSSGGVGSATAYTALNVGDVVSSASNFILLSGGGGAASTAAFQTAGPHVLGVRFFNETTSAINYGYIRFQNGATAGFPATITGWVYENTGAAITVVPEPSTTAMLGLGALTLGALKLRRQRRDKQA